MGKLKLELVLAKANVKVEALKTDEYLYGKETYHNMNGWNVAEGTRKLYQCALSEAVKETEEALSSGNGYRLNDAEIRLRTTYDLVEKVLELHEQ